MKRVELTVVDLLVRVASATEGASELSGKPNSSPYVDRILKRTGHKPGAPWCMAWISDVGEQALGALWPCPNTAGVMVLCDWAEKAKCRYIATKVPAKVGDVIALWFPTMKRWAHVAIVTAVSEDGKTVQTLEGNTNANGSREGWLVTRKTRTLTSRDRLIRWHEAIR